MAETISCPGCKSLYKLKDHTVLEGKNIKCKKCGTVFNLTATPTVMPEQPTIKQKHSEPTVKFERKQKGMLELSGKVLGGCRIEKKLGQGGMGTVYKAHHLALDIPVAVKVLSPQVAQADSSFVERFKREARSSAKLQHHNIVGVMNVGQENNLHYIIMQYVDGYSLQSLLQKRKKLPVSEAIDIMLQTCEALNLARKNMIVHRDIKPDNIMIDKEGVVKLADLGLAKQVNDDSSVTLSGITMGTPYYMAPEQAADARVADHRSDIYSLGCTLYRCVCGKVPYDGESAFTILNKHLNEPIPDAHVLNPDIPLSLTKIITCMMAKKPEDRYQSVEELKTELQKIAFAKNHIQSPENTPIFAKKKDKMSKKNKIILFFATFFLFFLFLIIIDNRKNIDKKSKTEQVISQKQIIKKQKEPPGVTPEPKQREKNKIALSPVKRENKFLTPIKFHALLKIANQSYRGGAHFKRNSKGQVIAADLREAKIDDISTLQNIKLIALDLRNTDVSDLSPLQGSEIKMLDLSMTPVTDISPLSDIGLETLVFNPKHTRKGINMLRQLKTLKLIGVDWEHRLPVADFWHEYDKKQKKLPRSRPLRRFLKKRFKKH